MVKLTMAGPERKMELYGQAYQAQNGKWNYMARLTRPRTDNEMLCQTKQG